MSEQQEDLSLLRNTEASLQMMLSNLEYYRDQVVEIREAIEEEIENAGPVVQLLQTFEFDAHVAIEEISNGINNLTEAVDMLPDE